MAGTPQGALMTTLPLVSVIVPTYNCERFANEAISSILTQDYPNIEVIVVDDGSTDGTIDGLPHKNPRVKVMQQKNAGPAAARNRGAAVARGEFLAFLDCDDVWLPGKLTAQVQFLLHNPEVCLVHGNYLDWYPDEAGSYPPASSFASQYAPAPQATSDSGWAYTELLVSFVLCTSTVLMRREHFQRVGGFDESFRIGEDYDLWLRLSRIAPMHKLDRLCILYRKHGANVTSRPPERNYAYRAVSSAISRHGLRGPDGRTADPEAVERYLAALCRSHAYNHFWRGNPCLAVEAISQTRKHGHLSWRWLAHDLIARARCIVLTVANKARKAGKRHA